MFLRARIDIEDTKHRYHHEKSRINVILIHSHGDHWQTGSQTDGQRKELNMALARSAPFRLLGWSSS